MSECELVSVSAWEWPRGSQDHHSVGFLAFHTANIFSPASSSVVVSRRSVGGDGGGISLHG